MNQQVNQLQVRPLPAKNDPAGWNRWLRGHYQDLQTWTTRVTTQVNFQVQSPGSVIASAPTLNLPANIHHVSGTAKISRFNAGPGHTGPIWLIADGLWQTVTGGNIKEATIVVVGRAYSWIFDGTFWFLVS